MAAVLRLEYIGMNSGYKKPWVAEIKGIDSKWGYEREFLDGKFDYSNANSKKSRDVYIEYNLESGLIYQADTNISWGKRIRYFCTVNNNGDIIVLNEGDIKEMVNQLEK